MVKDLGQMRKMWSDIIITRNGTTKDFVGWWNKIGKIKEIIKVLQI